MSIDVDKIAKLAQLEIKAEDKKQYEHDLENILTLVAQMNEVDVAAITPMAHPFDVKQPTRPDEVSQHVKESGQYEKLQNLTQQVEAGLYLVPQVIE